jgi:predicted transcriptional regulator
MFMKLTTVRELLKAQVLTGESENDLENIEVHVACGSDLMSDVLAFLKEQGLLLTGLINPQVVRTAEMMDICAICFVRGKTPTQDIIDLAKSLNMTVLTTEYPLFQACGRLYKGGLMCGED